MEKEYVKPAILVAKMEMESLLAAQSDEIELSDEEAKSWLGMSSNRFGFVDDEEE